MKSTCGAGTVASLFLLLACPLAAQPARELRGQVFHLGENGEKISEPGLIVTLVETGATDDANDQGIFRLPLPPAFQLGDSITISIDKPGWRIRFPLDGEARIPRATEILPVELLPVGSKLFWTNDRIEKLLRDASEHSKQEEKRDGGAPSLDLGREIKEWAVKYGFGAQEARDEIDRWIAEVEAAHEDDYQKGLAAFAKQQFDVAAERCRNSAAWRIRQLEETRKQEKGLAEKAERLQDEVVRDLRMEGDSHYYAYRFEQALTAYEQAYQYTTKDQTPQLWAATLGDIGRVHQELGKHGEASGSPVHFAAAVEVLRQALLLLTREKWPQDWATVQNNLGSALRDQGTRTAGEQGAQLLAQAVQTYQQALLGRTREQLPKEWADTQNNLGHVLFEQGLRTSGEESAQLLAQAVQAFRQALLVHTREQLPHGWMADQNNLGNALLEQGKRMAGDEGAQLLAQAVQSYGQALLVYTGKRPTKGWAIIQNNLGNALQEQGIRTSGEEGAQLLTQAVQVYRQALLVYTREQLPQDWAETQNSLGNALAEQGKRTSGDEGTQLLAQSVQAHRQALLVRTREQLPQDWARTQTSLGNALQEQGKRASGEAGAQLLAQAVDAYQQALLVLTPDHFSHWWAETRSSEAKALLALHRDKEAVEALSQVLAKVPDQKQAFELLGTILSNRLFSPQEAVALTRSWLSRHPDDLPARLALEEQLFASRAFSDSRQEANSLVKEQKLDAGHRVVALGYAIAAGLAMDSSEVPDRVEELLGVVTAQPQDFKTSWTFEGTLHSLGEDPEVPHKDLLLRLFQALAAPDRDSLLRGLRDVKGASGTFSRAPSS
jgi:tetratricopeptide (TPR) repeat protein